MNALLMSLALLATTSASAMPAKGKILVVVSSENQLPLKDGKSYPTGYYLNELGIPTKALADAGYALVFADPKGNSPAMDKTSDDPKYFTSPEQHQMIRSFVVSLNALRAPQSLSLVLAEGLDQYAAVFLPGGHAPMIDLMASPELGKILRHFHDAGKPTALICHGPVSLLAAVSDPRAYQAALISGDTQSAVKLAQNWIYSNYKMTVFSTAEEKMAAGKMGGETLFYPEDALRTAGAEVAVATPWTSNVTWYRELITGQNPFSDQELAATLLMALDAKK